MTDTAVTTIVETLNDLRSRELAVIVQYMRHHYELTGADSLEAADEMKSVAIAEMKHAEMLGERIDFLGGEPTAKPAEIGASAKALNQAASLDMASEEDAIRRYKSAINQASNAADPTTRRLLEDILSQEEDHLNTFQRMLGR